MRSGAVVALVSDAGMPAGLGPRLQFLVQACIAAGLSVEVLPGPSSALAALVASGLPADRWRFVGFLPRKKAELERLLLGTPETLVAFESPQRLVATLALLAAEGSRPAGRGLPGADQAARGGAPRPASEIGAHYQREPARGEVVLVVAAAAPGAQPDAQDRALTALRALVDAGARPRPAAKALSELTGVPANRLYRALTESADEPRPEARRGRTGGERARAEPPNRALS